MSETPASPPPASPPPASAPARPVSRSVFVPAWALVVVLGVAVVGLGFAIGRATEGHHRHVGGRGGSFLVLLVVVALIVTLVTLVARRGGQGSRGGAEHILTERFARGEIDEAEFRRRRDALRG